MEHTFNLRQISAFKVTLVYKSARARETISSKKQKTKKKNRKRERKRKKGRKEGRKEEERKN
nr:hypothetical protein [uncultured Desulfovibrio sp.]